MNALLLLTQNQKHISFFRFIKVKWPVLLTGKKLYERDESKKISKTSVTFKFIIALCKNLCYNKFANIYKKLSEVVI